MISSTGMPALRACSRTTASLAASYSQNENLPSAVMCERIQLIPISLPTLADFTRTASSCSGVSGGSVRVIMNRGISAYLARLEISAHFGRDFDDVVVRQGDR